MNPLRVLSFDDLYLLSMLLEGMTVTSVARNLALSQPAITQRLRKMERVFGYAVVEPVGRRVRLTREGRALASRAAGALTLMEGSQGQPTGSVVNVGTRPEVGWTWLWPSLTRLRHESPELTFHCFFGSGEEILRLLGTGGLDAVLTSAPHTVKGFGAIEVAREEYVLVAAPRIARTIKHSDDLREQVLIEHDRSFPFQRYVDAGARASMRFKDVWFLGSSHNMTRAIVEGFGVGVIPEYLARSHVKARQLSRILPSIKIDGDHFRLVHRQDRDIGPAVEKLAQAMIKTGLR